jgi:phosphatidylglycerol lysyltransferase
MSNTAVSKSFFRFVKGKSIPFFRENGRILAQFIFALLFIGLAIWFLKHEKTELHDVRNLIATSKWQVILIGSCLAVIYIILQGLMYKAALASLGSRVPLHSTIVLFLKRNFISVFLPAGGVSSLMFFTEDIEKRGISKSRIQLASSIYAFTGILSVVLVAVPAFLIAILHKSVNKGEIYALAGMIILIVLIFIAFRSVRRGGIVHRWMIRFFPVSELFLEDLRSGKINNRIYVLCVAASIGIEFSGMLLVYVAMTALNVHPSFFAAILGYIVSVVMMVASPFMRGLGAVEVSMSFVLARFGYSHVEAITITLLYRFFEFWLILFIGLGSFLLKMNKLLMRIVPTLLLLVLGVINIISVLTPAISSRLERLQDFLPLNAINASNYLVMVAGLFMLVTAAFMLKGLRSAWWFALILSLLSFIGHLTKAIDYEEAIVALVVVAVLIATHREYYVRTDPKLRSVGILTALLGTVAVLTYGTIGFYFLDKKHFDIDFSILQSIRYTLQNYFLANSSSLVPEDQFARHFLLSIRICGLCSMTFIVYAFIRPYTLKMNSAEEDRDRAEIILKLHGRSAMDYFKVYPDKLIYFFENGTSFISYKVAGNYAVVLEDPVAQDVGRMRGIIADFDRHCYENGLKSIYYRVPEESLPVYNGLGKKSLILGQEGVISLETFTMEGKDRKDLRHAVNKVTESGYKTTVHDPPVKDGILQKLKSVSDEWLQATGRKEIVFSQGQFDWSELKRQTLITVESPEEKIVAFLNIIPDFAPGEGTYDLIRKTNDAPNRTSEFLVIHLCEYLKMKGFRYVNLGFAPMSGIEDPQSFPERSIRFAYEKLRTFSHYKGLREYKERFFPEWHNKYLVYNNDYDLIQVPGVLAKVIRP